MERTAPLARRFLPLNLSSSISINNPFCYFSPLVATRLLDIFQNSIILRITIKKSRCVKFQGKDGVQGPAGAPGPQGPAGEFEMTERL